MVAVKVSPGDWQRDLPAEVRLPLVNRFYEQDPTNIEGPVALIARPGLVKWLTVGDGPIRGFASEQGAFGGALFVVSAGEAYRIDPDETVTLIGSGLYNPGGTIVSMTVTETYLFIADGQNLWYYTDNSYARGTLTASGDISATDQVVIGSYTYEWTSGDVNAGAPDGTSGNPWLVAIGTSNTDALDNLVAAIENSGTPGTDYSLALQGSIEVAVTSSTASEIVIRAADAGTDGNSLATTTTGANLAWGAATLTDGGSTAFDAVATPDSVGIVWVDTINSFVLCVCAEGAGKTGRFYWIEPGEIEIDDLNFATAERAPDPLYAIVVLSDQAWMFGSSTTEPWYMPGDVDAPFQRVSGRTFDHGIWQGTPVRLKDKLIVVDRDGVVYSIAGEVQRISDYSVEQRIREAMRAQIVAG